MSCGPAMTYWRILAWLFGPSIPLMLVFILYQRFEGTPHFFLHTLMGWDVGLIVLLAAMHYGRRPARWDGILPFLLALYALTPDFVYMAGPFHRDWMDVFLFHVALDEILPFALPMLALIWVVLLVEYVRWRPTPLQHAQDERWRTIVARPLCTPLSIGLSSVVFASLLRHFTHVQAAHAPDSHSGS